MATKFYQLLCSDAWSRRRGSSGTAGEGGGRGERLRLPRGLRLDFYVAGLVPGFEYAVVVMILASGEEKHTRKGAIMQQFAKNFTYGTTIAGDGAQEEEEEEEEEEARGGGGGGGHPAAHVRFEISPGEAASFIHAGAGRTGAHLRKQFR